MYSGYQWGLLPRLPQFLARILESLRDLLINSLIVFQVFLRFPELLCNSS